jgi:hypothetical protein
MPTAIERLDSLNQRFLEIRPFSSRPACPLSPTNTDAIKPIIPGAIHGGQ